jgi:hypothetical protein
MNVQNKTRTQFDKFRLSFLVLSVIHFPCESVWRTLWSQPKFNMMKALFGGDGMPDPPNIATPDGSSLAGDPDSLFSEENPSGNEKDTNMGAANVAMPINTHGKRLPWSPDTELSPV